MMNEINPLSWSQLTRWRNECVERFGTTTSMPTIKSPYHELEKLLKPNVKVLDIGAGTEKPLKKRVEGQGRAYFSLDVDQAGEFNYHTFEDIPTEQRFQLMWANQVLEHVPIHLGYQIVCGAFQYLEEGGWFLATVPNPAHPVRYWADATHIQHWPASDLYGLFREAGFEVPLLARYNKHRYPRNPLKRLVTGIVVEVFRMDWCDSLFIIGQKPR